MKSGADETFRAAALNVYNQISDRDALNRTVTRIRILSKS